MTLPPNTPPAYNGQPVYAPVQEDPKANNVMIFGIIGIFFGIFAFIGWAIGSGAQKQALAEGRPIDPKLKTWTTVSKVVSIIYIVFAVIWIVILIAGMAMLGTY